MKTITYDEKSFLIDGTRIWINGGETHYFRLPREEWRDALLRIKRAGLNTVCTYIAWNFHEQEKDCFDFTGDHDLGHYIDLAAELGLYVMVRPGPYICSEWEGGGIPGWLCAEGVLRYREDDPVYIARLRRWFDELLPIISSRQITRGGPVITIQNENEYPGGWDDSMRRYIAGINVFFRKHGIDIPVLACNVHGASDTLCKINDSTDPNDQILDSDMILTYNHYLVAPVYDLKKQRPDHPLIVTEFWSGSPMWWGNHVCDKDGGWPTTRDMGRASYEFAASGTQLCLYMFEGGTNFAFWGGCNIAASYASSYPVRDGGRLADKYYGLHPALNFCGTFGDILADSEIVPDQTGLRADEGVLLTVKRSGAGCLVFVSAADGRRNTALTLLNGKRLDVHWGEVDASVHPYGLRVTDSVTVDYTNLCLLARSGNILALYGEAGTEGVISVNGVEHNFHIGYHAVETKIIGDITVAIADEEMARRCWVVEDDMIIFGPDFVGEKNEVGEYTLYNGISTPNTVICEGQAHRSIPAVYHPANDSLPALEDWRIARCPELAGGLDWKPVDEPKSHELLGFPLGYVWYKASWDSPSNDVMKMYLPNTPNRVSVFVNGRYTGTHAERRWVRMRDEYSHPADWAFEELTVEVRKGSNEFVFLSDNQGHNYDVPISVGIQGATSLGSSMVDITPRVCEPRPVSENAFRFLYNRRYRTAEPLPGVEFELVLEPDEQAFIVTHGIQAWLTVDGEDVLPMSWPESPWTMFPQIKRWITWQLTGGVNKVCIQHAGEQNDVREHIMVYKAPLSGKLSNWQYKPWEPSVEFVTPGEGYEGTTDNSPPILLPVGGYVARKGRDLTPACYETHFTMPLGNRPVYLDIGEMRKGQIYLNGINTGRFWKFGGTQDLYYLPRAWMKPENTLVIFEELGLPPQKAQLVFGGPALTKTSL